MPRKIVQPPKYQFPAWDGRIDAKPYALKLAADMAAMPRHEFYAWLADKTEVERVLALRLRFRFDRMWFLTYCWPDNFNLPFNKYHVETLTEPKRFWAHRVPHNENRSVAAPRGIAKTTTSKGDLCHDAVYGLEGFTVVHSSGLREGSEPFVKDVANMLTASPMLNYLYGPSEAWRDGEITVVQVGDAPPAPFMARSFKTQVRGINYRLQRPTKYVIDDGEHPDRVKNPDNRKADNQFLKEDIANVGPKEGGLLLDMRGTMIHADSLLMETRSGPSAPAWKHKTWQSIITWPKNTGLWEQARILWSDLTDPDRKASAEEFYRQNQEAMDEGAEVLDPVAAPLFTLYTRIWSNGMASFMKDQQNDILNTSTKFFDLNKAVFYDLEQDYHGRMFVRSGAKNNVVSFVDEMDRVLYLDPIPADQLGDLAVEGSGGSDFAAIAVLGKDKFGTVFLLELWLSKARDSEQVEALFHLAEKWGVRKGYIEPVGFGRMITRDFLRLRQERQKAGRFCDIEVEPDTQNNNVPKNDRIAKLEGPLTTTNWLRLPRNLSDEARGQFRDFPNGSHDDAPDAVAGAYTAMGGSPPKPQAGAIKMR